MAIVCGLLQVGRRLQVPDNKAEELLYPALSTLLDSSRPTRTHPTWRAILWRRDGVELEFRRQVAEEECREQRE